jgi:hypothetical protein
MRILLAALALLVTAPAFANEGDLKCNVGPITKTFGETQWRVYSCNEDRHLMFVAAPGSPAGQVILMLFWEKGRWLIIDMGPTTRAADAARTEIQSLSEGAIVGLVAETKSH